MAGDRLVGHRTEMSSMTKTKAAREAARSLASSVGAVHHLTLHQVAILQTSHASRDLVSLRTEGGRIFECVWKYGERERRERKKERKKKEREKRERKKRAEVLSLQIFFFIS